MARHQVYMNKERHLEIKGCIKIQGLIGSSTMSMLMARLILGRVIYRHGNNPNIILKVVIVNLNMP